MIRAFFKRLLFATHRRPFHCGFCPRINKVYEEVQVVRAEIGVLRCDLERIIQENREPRAIREDIAEQIRGYWKTMIENRYDIERRERAQRLQDFIDDLNSRIQSIEERLRKK